MRQERGVFVVPYKNIKTEEVTSGYKQGEMTERLKVQTWKVCVSQKGTEGSNPSLSVFYIALRIS